MRHVRRGVTVAAAVALVLAACSGGGGDATPTTTSTRATSSSSSSTSTTAPSTTTSAKRAWPGVATSGEVKAIVTARGLVLPVEADGRVMTPCGNPGQVGGTPLYGAQVVLDPGHGGDEPGAVGPAGLKEKDVNLAVAQETQRILEATGATVVLTRTSDYRITLRARAEIAQRLRPVAFVSIHHNAEPDESRSTPGSETYFQIGSSRSKRLAGLVYRHVYEAFATHDIAWTADRDAGAKYRPADDGGDYYGILRRSAGVPTALSEAAFLSNAPEEALLATKAFRHVEAQAIADAIVAFATTDEPGSGYVTPYPRTAPAGSGGGPQGCVDPPY
jgi:N-acetylmuramoyl-L-alanine amidase